MEVADLEFEEAGILAPLYNQFAEDVPFSFPVDEDEFATGILSQWEDHGYHRHLHDQHLLVCRSAGQVVGFAHVATGPWDRVERGLIRFLCFLPGDRATGQHLLESCEKRLRDLGASESLAFPRGYAYPFHHKATGTLAGKLAHVIGLLGANTYALAPDPPYPRCEEILFDWPDYAVSAPAPPDRGLSVEMSVSEGIAELPKAIFHLRLDGNVVGESETWPVGRWSRAKEARELFAVSIDIEKEWQGRGWGGYLLRYALHEMRGLGYRRAALGTNLSNYRAIAFYSNLGYKVAGTAYTFHKQLN